MTRCFTLFVILAAGALITMPGCNKSAKTEPKSTAAAMGAMNDKCPMTNMAVNKNAPTTTYHGKTVGFCCGGCASKWDALSETDKDKKMAAMASTTAK